MSDSTNAIETTPKNEDNINENEEQKNQVDKDESSVLLNNGKDEKMIDKDLEKGEEKEKAKVGGLDIN